MSEEPSKRSYKRRSVEEVQGIVEEKKIIERYEAGEDAEVLAAECGVDRSTLIRWLQKLEVEPRTIRVKDASTEVAKISQSKVVERAKEEMNAAISLGVPIASEHSDWLHYMRSKGKSLHEISTELVEWYLRKEDVERKVTEMEREIADLMKEKENLSAYVAPNIRFHLKMNLLQWLWTKLLKANILGIPMDTSLTLERFKQAIDLIDRKTPMELTEELKT